MEQAHETSIKNIQFLSSLETWIVFELIGAEIEYAYNGIIKECGKTITAFTIKGNLTNAQKDIIKSLPLECYY